MPQVWSLLIGFVFGLVVLAACGEEAPAPGTPAPDATGAPTPAPALTPMPTATLSSTPTPVPVPEGWIAVYIEGARFVAEVADTQAARQQGLSGRPSMALHEGMWFDFGREVQAAFWMKDMHFALDMVWVDGGLNVVAVSHHVPPPEPGTPDQALPLYDSGGIPVRYVLEINAGLAEQYAIGPGSVVHLGSSEQ